MCRGSVNTEEYLPNSACQMREVASKEWQSNLFSDYFLLLPIKVANRFWMECWVVFFFILGDY